MTDTTKLETLHNLLADAQRKLILDAAESDALPASGTITRIADLEHALVAVDNAIDDLEANPAER